VHEHLHCIWKPVRSELHSCEIILFCVTTATNLSVLTLLTCLVVSYKGISHLGVRNKWLYSSAQLKQTDVNSSCFNASHMLEWGYTYCAHRPSSMVLWVTGVQFGGKTGKCGPSTKLIVLGLSPYQSEFSAECDLVLTLPVSSILSFQWSHSVAAYVFLLVFPSFLFPSIAGFRRQFLRKMWPI